MLDVVGADALTVIANTGDDIEIYGAYVSPDPDLVTFWLADVIDERGWGLAGDTFAVMAGLNALGVETWFNLGDRDLAIGLERARRLRAGERLTDAHKAIAHALGVPATVLPMSDEPVRTQVLADARWRPFQEYMIKAGGAPRTGGAIEDVAFRGAAAARATPEVRAAIASARAIVIGPSNPVISIAPILAVGGMRSAISDSRAPVVAISPLVGGQVVKGPTKAFMEFTRVPLTSDGIATYYDGLIDGLVADQRADRITVLETDVLMDTRAARRRVADEALRFALSLG
jgi:LPPG:FO 2-phospho-L-lactate transferase